MSTESRLTDLAARIAVEFNAVRAEGTARVSVVTGDEDRPNVAFVIWLGGETQPVNMIDGDMWFQPTGTDPGGVPPTITTTSLNALTEDQAFSQTLAATGSPTAWSIQSGGITGLSIDNSGVLSGTPTVAGAYSMVVRATNADGFDEQTYTGTVTAAGGGGVTGASIYGDNAPGTGWTIGNDGGGSLFVGTRFYTTEPGGIDVLGLRLWEPATADSTFLNLDITARAYTNDWTGTYITNTLNVGTPVQTKTQLHSPHSG